MTPIEAVAARIEHVNRRVDGDRATLIGISGINASGKGWLTTRVRQALQARGVRVAQISAEEWRNPPSLEFPDTDADGHFYRRGLRLDDLFGDLILPLRTRRSIDIEFDRLDPSRLVLDRVRRAYERVDVILLEGIFILKAAYQKIFDWSLWVDCSFETALERVARRDPDDLMLAEVVAAHQRIYFPAQRRHLDVDDPISATDCTFNNDWRLPLDLKRTIRQWSNHP
jgi:uridine kinase